MFSIKTNRTGILCAVSCFALFATVPIAKGQEATAKIYLTPVTGRSDITFNLGGYYSDLDINGQTLTVPQGGGRVFLDAQASDWGSQRLRSFWLRTDSSTYLGENADPPNPGCDLTLAVEACGNSGDCLMAFGAGEGISCLQSGLCAPIWMNESHNDWIFNDPSIFGDSKQRRIFYRPLRSGLLGHFG